MIRKVELAYCTETLITEIYHHGTTRKQVAKLYALALKSSEKTDWKRVNKAILERWSPYGLGYIKRLALSGKCFDGSYSPMVLGRVKEQVAK